MTKLNLSKIKPNRYYIIIVLLTFIVFGNGINNEYALDDNLVTEGVEKVEKGVSGIKEIFTTSYATGKQNYGYRPLVQTTFALEKQLFKNLPVSQTLKEKKRKDKLTQANISHFVNVLLYAFLCVVLFSFLVELFDNYNIILPLTITLLFLVHPLHTEPVDNIKSRDEILMLLMMILSMKHYLKYSIVGNVKHLLLGSLFVFLSILSKKNAIALIGLVPVVLFFHKASFKKIAVSMGSIIVIFFFFILMKKGLVSSSGGARNIKYFEAPLKFGGSFMDKITMGLYCSWFYFKMLLFPKELSFYYGFNQIPLANWSHWQVWASILLYVPMAIYGFILFIKRKVLGLGIAIWIGLMLGTINVFFPIVGIVADRFAFSLSIGFCIVLGYLLLKVFKLDLTKDSYTVNLPTGFLLVFSGIMLIYSVRSIVRNPEWHDHMTLYETDIEHLSESAKAHALLANTYYPILSKEVRSTPGNLENRKKVDKLIYHYKEALRIDPTYLTSINNLGSVYMNFLADYENTIYYCEQAVAMDENYLEAHFNLSTAYKAKGDVDKTLYHFSKVIEIEPTRMEVYQAFNSYANEKGKIKHAIELMKETANRVEDPKNVYLNTANLYSLDEYNVEQSLVYFVKAFETDSTDKQLCGHIVKLYNSIGNTEKANLYASYCSQ